MGQITLSRAATVEVARRAKLRTQRRCRPVSREHRKQRRPFGPESIDLRQPLISNKEEGPIPKHRPAQCCTKLVLLQCWSRLARTLHKKVVRIEDIVPQELPRAAVKLIRAGLAHQVDIRSGSAAIRRVEVGSLHHELLD